MVHDLCEEHAANVRVPRGWELRDQRLTGSEVHELAQGSVVRSVRFDLIGA